MKQVLWSIVFCHGLLSVDPGLAVEVVGAKETLRFLPGLEYRVETDNEAIGSKCFNLFVPLDYTDDRDWPVIFLFKGLFSPTILSSMRWTTCDRGAILVGMGYVEIIRKEQRMTSGQFVAHIKREIESIQAVKTCLRKYLRIDKDRMFITGASAGGWHTSLLLECRAQLWAGAMIFAAGRHRSAVALTNDYSSFAFRNMPIYFGSSPQGSHGGNHPSALQAAQLYRQRGALVIFDTIDKRINTPLRREWARTYMLDPVTGSTRSHKTRFTPIEPVELSEKTSTTIIKDAIAKQLNKPVDQLTGEDLAGVKALCLTGQYVSDLSYIRELRNLESLDVSFTFIDDIEPLLACQQLQTLNISGTGVKDIGSLKGLPNLRHLSMWHIWVERDQIDTLKGRLPSLSIKDFQWDLYEKDATGLVVPKLKVRID